MSFEPIRAKGLPPLPKIRQIAILVDDNNYSQTDLYAQIILRELPDDPHANLIAAWVAKHFDLRESFDNFFQKAKINTQNGKRSIEALATDLHIELEGMLAYEGQVIKADIESYNIKKYAIKNHADNVETFHLIKAWGFGFGSEMASLMGQAYLAEITGRTPVVHWGRNFLYRSEGYECVFEHFFQPFNSLSIQSVLQKQPISFFPPKWNAVNLIDENIQKRTGEYSKMSALYYLSRSEQLTVADYYAGVINIKPWLPKGHQLQSLSFDGTYRYLMKKYLRPQKAIQIIADQFVKSEIAVPFIAVHARGSDKDEGYRAMTSIPMKTLHYAKQRLLLLSADAKLFLMTDDQSLLELYQREFGQRLITTDSQRSSSDVGVHYDVSSDKRSAGQEMLVDMLIASQADFFIGLGLSNPSQLIYYMGEFSRENYVLFGENRLKQFNTHLYQTVSVR